MFPNWPGFQVSVFTLVRRKKDNYHPLTSVASPQVKRSPDLSQSADADDPDVHAALEGAPLLERGVHRDAGAEDGAGRLQRVALRDLKN